MLHVEGRDDVDAGVSNLLDALPALLVHGAGDVGVGELIDEHPLRPPLDHRRSVQLEEGLAAVLQLLQRYLLKPLQQLRRHRAPVRLDEPDDNVFTPRQTPVRLGEHPVGLPDTGDSAKKDLQLACVPALERWAYQHVRRSLRTLAVRPVQRQVQLKHVHAPLTEEAEIALVGVLVDETHDLFLAHVPCSRDAGHLRVGVRRRDVGVQAAAGRGHHVDRHLARLKPRVLRDDGLNGGAHPVD